MAVILPLAVSWAVAADYPLTVIDLEHRVSEDVVPVLEALVGPAGSIAGANNSLFVRASPQALDEIRQALRRIDVPARNLLVEVRRSGRHSAGGVDVGVRADERVGDRARVRIGETRRGHPRPGSRAWAVAGSASGENMIEQRLRVLDGQQGFIAVGSEQPVGHRERILGPAGVVTRGGTGYRTTGSGFYVRPRVHDGRVSIEISAADARFGHGRGGSVERSVVETRVSGRLGEWIDLGQSTSSRSSSGRGLLSASGSTRSRYDGLQVRVSIAP
jgi:hypothetical protein